MEEGGREEKEGRRQRGDSGENGMGEGERRREVRREFWSTDSFLGCICYHKPYTKNQTNNNKMGQLLSQEISTIRTMEDELVRKISR